MACATPSVDPAARAPASLEHLGLIWFVPVMGLAGLALAWQQAAALLGEGAALAAQLLAGLAAVLFGVLLLLSFGRVARWPQVSRVEWMHPVRYVFTAAVPVSLILLATLGVVLTGPEKAWNALWMVGSAGQALLTLAVAWRWWRLRAARWPGVTPGLLIPVVGNVLVPLAGVALGHAVWASVQWAVGVVLWPLVLALLVVRQRRIGPWPERLRSSVFVLVAPPAVIGLGLMVWQVGPVPVFLCWGIALGVVGWAFAQLPRCFEQPFGMPMWSLSFPLAAFASLSLRLAQAGWLPGWLALLVLALASMVVAALLRWTWWGLRSGELLQPEPGPVPRP